MYLCIIPSLSPLHAAHVEVTALESINQQLFDAIRSGKLDEVKAAFAAGAHIDAKDKDGFTPVIIAAGRGYEDIIRYLIEEKKADANTKIDDFTPLSVAAMLGRLNIVKYLVDERHVAINAMYSNEYPAFYWATKKGHLAIVKYFAERPKFNPDIDGVVAMSLAHEKNHQAIIDYLITRGIPPLPKARGPKDIFYSYKANARINFTPLKVLAYNRMPIAPSSEIVAMSQGGMMHIYQLKVLKQGGTEEPCTVEPLGNKIWLTLEEAVNKLGGTKEMHCAANPVFGGTCAYHAVKNGLLGLAMLYDYDALVTCLDSGQECEKNAAWVSADIDNLVTLKTKNFDCERFIEQLHAKIFMFKNEPMFGSLEPINIQQSFSTSRMHIARHDVDNELNSLMTNRYQVPAGKYDNSFSFVDQGTIRAAQDPYQIEQYLTNCQTLYDKKNSFYEIIGQIQGTDLLKQIVLFRTNAQYKHAFILSLNEASFSGWGTSYDGQMHAIAVIVDKRDSVVNVIIGESNNAPHYAIKQILLDFLNLLIDDKKCVLTKDQIEHLKECSTNTIAGHWIETKQEFLPSFKSLIDAYVEALKQPTRSNIERAFFLLSKIEHIYNQAHARKDEDEKTFTAIEKLLPDSLKQGMRAEEIRLHKIMQDLEGKELNDKLFSFIGMNDLAKVKKSLEVGARIDGRDNSGETPLMRAVILGHLDIVEYLHSQGASIEDVTPKGQTPLMLAAQWGKPQIMEYLINHGADVNAKDNEGNNILMYAASGGFDENKKLEIVKLLIEKYKIDPTITNNSGQTALLMSAYVGAVEVVKYFINTLHMAINLESLVNFIMQDQKIPGNIHWQSPSLTIIDYLITEYGLTAQKHPSLTLKVLIAAVKKQNLPLIKRLLEPDCGMSIDAQDENGWTALMYAAQAGDSSWVYIINPLIEEFHADISLKNKDGQTALDIARKSNHSKKSRSGRGLLFGLGDIEYFTHDNVIQLLEKLEAANKLP